MQEILPDKESLGSNQSILPSSTFASYWGVLGILTESRSAAEAERVLRVRREPTINFVLMNHSEEEYEIDVSSG